MKKKIFNFLFLGIIPTTMFFQKVNAQVTAIQGSTHTYSVTPVPNGINYNYYWSVTGGTSSSFSIANNSGDITWDGLPGQYTISVYPVNPLTGCIGNSQSLTVTVVTMGSVILTGPALICPKTDNQTGEFMVTISYSGADAWSFQLNDGRTLQTINVIAGTTEYNLTLTGITNPSPSLNLAQTIRLISFTNGNGTVTFDGTETNPENHTITINILPTPEVSGIIQN